MVITVIKLTEVMFFLPPPKNGGQKSKWNQDNAVRHSSAKDKTHRDADISEKKVNVDSDEDNINARQRLESDKEHAQSVPGSSRQVSSEKLPKEGDQKKSGRNVKNLVWTTCSIVCETRHKAIGKEI